MRIRMVFLMKTRIEIEIEMRMICICACIAVADANRNRNANRSRSQVGVGVNSSITIIPIPPTLLNFCISRSFAIDRFSYTRFKVSKRNLCRVELAAIPVSCSWRVYYIDSHPNPIQSGGSSDICLRSQPSIFVLGQKSSKGLAEVDAGISATNRASQALRIFLVFFVSSVFR